MNQLPLDHTASEPVDKVQSNSAQIQRDLSHLNTQNLVSSVNTNTGTIEWLGRVHDLHPRVRESQFL